MKQMTHAHASMLLLNVRAMASHPGRLAWMTVAMLGQDLLFFGAWIVFFHALGTVWGWDLRSICLLYGLNAFGFGLLHFASDGTRDISQCIHDGQLELYLSRPTPPLLWLKTAKFNPSSLGNALSGLLFFTVGARLGLASLAIALLASVMVGTLFEALQVIYRSIVFFVPKSSSLSEYMVEASYYLTTVPEDGQGRLMQMLMFTLVPVGFMVMVPVHMLRDHAWSLLAVLAAATVVYSFLATLIFRWGIERYRRTG